MSQSAFARRPIRATARLNEAARLAVTEPDDVTALTACAQQAALDAIPSGTNLLITIDCDGLDPIVIPGVIGPAQGGLSYWQTVELLQGSAQRARIAAFDLVEFMPERDIQQQGALAAARLLANAIGLIARQRGR